MNSNWFNMIAAPLLIGMAVLLSQCTGASTRWDNLSGKTMGTHYQVHFLSDATVARVEIELEIETKLKAIESELSTWSAESWISQWNQLPKGSVLKVPAHAKAVLENSLSVAQVSQDTFSPAALPLTEIWGFASHRGQKIQEPTSDSISDRLKLCDYRTLKFNSSKDSLSKTQDGVQIDLSASAKGYAVDQLAAVLEKYQVSNYLINIGGEIRVAGHNKHGKHWRLAIDTPYDFSGEAPVIELTNLAVATSGGSQITKVINKTKRTHILDLRTGYPLAGSHEVFSVSVVTDECMLADSLATAAFVLGPEASYSLIEAFPQCALIFILHDHSTISMGAPHLRTLLKMPEAQPALKPAL